MEDWPCDYCKEIQTNNKRPYYPINTATKRVDSVCANCYANFMGEQPGQAPSAHSTDQ